MIPPSQIQEIPTSREACRAEFRQAIIAKDPASFTRAEIARLKRLMLRGKVNPEFALFLRGEVDNKPHHD